MAIHDIYLTVTIVFVMLNGQDMGKATGFFYVREGKTYLITNMHVVKDFEIADRKIDPDCLRLMLHTNARDIRENMPLEIPLYKDRKPVWFSHPSYPDSKIDIAVIPLDQNKLEKKYTYRGLSQEVLYPSKYIIQPGEEIFVMGYPLGIFDNFHNLPLSRDAMIASVYGVPFRNMPFFLIDSKLNPGMSGGPVFTKPRNIFQNSDGNTNMVSGSPIYFLGVHSATLSAILQDGSREQLELGTVWYAKLIEEIIDQNIN